MSAWTWVEPFAGAAACALRLVGGRDLAPPVAWMGGKRRYARAILDALAVPEERPARVRLADAGPWGWVWPLLLEPVGAARVAAVLRSWSGEHPRDLWQRLAAQPPAEELHERGAQWLWLQARSASGVPIWWDGWRFRNEDRIEPQSTWGRYGEDNAGRWKASDGRGVDRPAGARAVGGRWEVGKTEGRTSSQGAWQKGNVGRVQPAANGQRGDEPGSWRFAGRPDRVQEDRPACMSSDKTLAGWRMGEEVTKARRGTRTISEKGTAAGRTGGMVFPGTIADRVEAIARGFAGLEVQVRHADARGIEVGPGFVYLDPPYVGATGYGWDMPRAEVLALAQRWADAGAVVAVSEAEPLALPGWHHLELTRTGGKPEWLTLSRAPARRPERQFALFEGRP